MSLYKYVANKINVYDASNIPSLSLNQLFYHNYSSFMSCDFINKLSINYESNKSGSPGVVGLGLYCNRGTHKYFTNNSTSFVNNANHKTISCKEGFSKIKFKYGDWLNGITGYQCAGETSMTNVDYAYDGSESGTVKCPTSSEALANLHVGFRPHNFKNYLNTLIFDNCYSITKTCKNGQSLTNNCRCINACVCTSPFTRCSNSCVSKCDSAHSNPCEGCNKCAFGYTPPSYGTNIKTNNCNKICNTNYAMNDNGRCFLQCSLGKVPKNNNGSIVNFCKGTNCNCAYYL